MWKLSNPFKKSPVRTASKTIPLDKRRFFKSNFFNGPHHLWIVEDKYIKCIFDELFDLLPEHIIDFLNAGPQLVFLTSNGRYSCALSIKDSRIIVVFPELMQLMKSPATYHAMAILAHEIGHIYLGHAVRDISPLEAQIEADKFASDLGFGQQIESFLQDLEECVEKRVRISRITCAIMTNSPQ